MLVLSVPRKTLISLADDECEYFSEAANPISTYSTVTECFVRQVATLMVM